MDILNNLLIINSHKKKRIGSLEKNQRNLRKQANQTNFNRVRIFVFKLLLLLINKS